LKNQSGANAYFKNRSNKRIALKKKGQLLFFYIAADRLLKCAFPLDWFFVGEIDFQHLKTNIFREV